jgi:hypothetical protein
MGGDDTSLIPSVFIGASDAELISKRFTYQVMMLEIREY